MSGFKRLAAPVVELRFLVVLAETVPRASERCIAERRNSRSALSALTFRYFGMGPKEGLNNSEIVIARRRRRRSNPVASYAGGVSGSPRPLRGLAMTDFFRGSLGEEK